MSVPGPVQPVPLQLQQDLQVEQRSDIANVEDAVEDAVEEEVEVDTKVAEAAAAMERITVEEPAKVKKGSAGKTIKVISNYIRSVDLFFTFYL